AVNLGSNWGPDLAIKAFHDLDTAFFGSTLAGYTTIRWIRGSQAHAMGEPTALGLTIDGSTFGKSQDIYLNAHQIWKIGSAPGHFRQIWFSVSRNPITTLRGKYHLTLEL
ncbi:MAG: hypothetical protein Q9169_006169, partial [Polycauliona sp. 2 TL-2023]